MNKNQRFLSNYLQSLLVAATPKTPTNAAKTTFSFSTAKLGEGIYYYQLIQNEKVVGSGKLIIVH